MRNPVAVTLIRLCAQAEEVIGFYGALQARPINRRRDGPFKRELPRGSQEVDFQRRVDIIECSIAGEILSLGIYDA